MTKTFPISKQFEIACWNDLIAKFYLNSQLEHAKYERKEMKFELNLKSTENNAIVL